MTPRISICIPNFNRAKCLEQVLDDCVNQTVQPYEIIVQDDSTDRREMRKIDRLITRFPQLRFYRNKHNIGLAANVNRVIRKSKGDFIAIVNNDDRLSVRYIECLQHAVSQHPKFNIYITNACAIDDDIKVTGEYRITQGNCVLKKGKGIQLLWRRYMINLISISGATLYRRTYLIEHMFHASYGNESDLNHALNLLSSQNLLYIDLPLYFVRMNTQNTSVLIRAESQRRNDYIHRCLHIYGTYQHAFKHIRWYMETPKSLYFLQLFIKYRYPLRAVLKQLTIRSVSEGLRIAYLALRYPFIYGLDTVRFYLHKKEISTFAPAR